MSGAQVIPDWRDPLVNTPAEVYDNMRKRMAEAQKLAGREAELILALRVNGWMLRHAADISLAAMTELAAIIAPEKQP